MTQNKKPKWDGKSRISNEVYRRRFNEIFKKKKIVPHIRLSGVIGAVGKFKQGLDFVGQKEIIEK